MDGLCELISFLVQSHDHKGDEQKTWQPSPQLQYEIELKNDPKTNTLPAVMVSGRNSHALYIYVPFLHRFEGLKEYGTKKTIQPLNSIRSTCIALLKVTEYEFTNYTPDRQNLSLQTKTHKKVQTNNEELDIPNSVQN